MSETKGHEVKDILHIPLTQTCVKMREELKLTMTFIILNPNRHSDRIERYKDGEPDSWTIISAAAGLYVRGARH